MATQHTKLICNASEDAIDTILYTENHHESSDGFVLVENDTLSQHTFYPKNNVTHDLDTFHPTKQNNLRQKMCLLFLYVQCHYLSGVNTSILAPFFPQEAEKHGMSVILISLTFSLLPITNFIFCPIFGRYMNRIGPKFVLISGFVTAGVCSLLYGTLEYCPKGTYFVVLSLLIRTVEAVGSAGYFTTILAMSSSEFPNHVNIMYALLQAAAELGLMIGPVIGGALYTVGGFSFPFYVIGVFILLNAVILYFLFPPTVTDDATILPITTLVRNPSVIIAVFGILSTGLGLYFLESTLASHLAPLNMSPVVVGAFFFIAPAFFAVTAPIYGYLVNAKNLQNILCVWGNSCFAIGFFLLGPAIIFPFLEFGISNIVIGLVFVGTSFCCCLVSTNKVLLKSAFDSGWKENVDTYGTVFGIANGAYFLGCAIGPLIGGSLVTEEYGYALPYTVVGAIGVLMVISTLPLLHLSRK